MCQMAKVPNNREQTTFSYQKGGLSPKYARERVRPLANTQVLESLLQKNISRVQVFFRCIGMARGLDTAWCNCSRWCGAVFLFATNSGFSD